MLSYGLFAFTVFGKQGLTYQLPIGLYHAVIITVIYHFTYHL